MAEATELEQIISLDRVRETDPQVWELAQREARKQAAQIRLIPSENYASAAVLEALATAFSNKYSEGYPGENKRYYEGQEYVDQIETLAIERLRGLFGCDHANVQPYSGSPANLAVYFALLKPGDTVMGLDLPMGGHLTHGWKANFSGMLYHSEAYSADPETGMLDYDQIRDQARRVRPKLIIAGATAYPRQFDFAAFGEIAREVDAYFLADIAHINGLIVGGVHPDPVPHADVVSSRATRCCADLAAASSCARTGRSTALPARTPRKPSTVCPAELTAPSSPTCRVARTRTPSPPSPSPSRRRRGRISATTPRRSSPTPTAWPRSCWATAST